MRTYYSRMLWLALALLVGCAIVNFVPSVSSQFPVKKGLDLAGGTRAVLQMQQAPGSPPINSETQSQVLQIMQNRINAYGIAEPVVQAKGSDQIVVEMPQTPGKSLEQQRKDLSELIQPAKLEFIWLKDVKTLGAPGESGGNPTSRYIYEGGNNIKDGDTNKELTPDEVQKQILYADPSNIIVTGADLKPNGAAVDINTGVGGRGVVTKLSFNDEGTRKFAEFTRNNVGALLAIVLNGQITQAPRIKDAITDGTAVIEGGSNQTVQQAQDLANLLNAGALPVPLKELSSSSVEATLGQTAVKSAIQGGIIGICLVLLFMIGYYYLPGVVAAIALLIYAALTFTVFRLIHVTLTLPGIAGFILSIGMAVDANILIFERMKEEMRAGRTLHAAVDAGFDRAWTSIRDSNIATLITCFVLYSFGTGPIKGFALVLALGVIFSLFTAVTISRALLHELVNQEWAHNPKYFRVGTGSLGWGQQAERKHWDIMGKWRTWVAISLLLILVGWAFNIAHWAKFGTPTRLGIDFTGGSTFTYTMAPGKTVSDSDVRTLFAKDGLPDAQIERITGGPITVRTKEATEAQVATVATDMQKTFGARQDAVEKVGPTISKELTQQAVMAIVGAVVLILLYLAYAFGQFGFKDGLRYGGAATFSLVHDVLFIFGFMGFVGYFFHWEMNSLFVTAALTIIGFTNHDTIVVFDRIRENSKIHGKEMTFPQIANAAIVQTLGRSINTSFTVILTLAALLVFGTKGSLDLKIFTSILLAGIVIGTYSSIFFATPVLMWLEGRKRQAEAAAVTRKPSAAETKTFAAPKATPKAAPAPRPTVSAPKPADGTTNGTTTSTSDATAAERPKTPASTGKKPKRRF